MSEEIRYMHRYKGCMETELVLGERWLRLIYASPIGCLPLWMAIKRGWFSRWYGRKMSHPKSKSRIPDFIREFDIDETELAEPASSHACFNDFFSRKLKKEARPICKSPQKIAFPADGRHLGFQNVSETSSIFVKGQQFDLPSLFRSEELAKPYEKGTLVISRLCPTDYHRFHFPIDGVATTPDLINGPLFSVNPIALRKNISIFWKNKRYLNFSDNPRVGRVAQFLVGATCVGSVTITAKLPQEVKKGEEFGYFSFGGSTVLTLFEENKVALSNDLLECSSQCIELYARMGEEMGEIEATDQR